MINEWEANFAIMSVDDPRCSVLKFSSLDLCESEILMLMLLQYEDIGKIITLYMVSAVEGLIFRHTLASNLILEDTFLYILSNWLNRFRF